MKNLNNLCVMNNFRMRDEREKDRSERQAREEREFKLQMEKEYSDRP